MKKKYLLPILFLYFFTLPLMAQERTTKEILTSYKWCKSKEDLAGYMDPDFPEEPRPIEVYIIYNNTECTTYRRWSDEPNQLETITSRYYVGIEGVDVKINKPNSNFFDRYSPAKFNASKLGQNINGDFLLEECVGDDEAHIIKIIELTDKKLVLQLSTPETFGSGVITTWEARPKD